MREARDSRFRAIAKPVYKLVDTCAAEFEAATPYYYSTLRDTVHGVGGRRSAVSGEDADCFAADRRPPTADR